MLVNNIAKITSRLIDKYAKSCTVTTKDGKVITAKVMTEQLWKKDKVRFETNPTQIGYNQKNYIKCIFALDVTSFGKDDIMNLMGKNVGSCRLPLYGMEQEKIDKLASALKNAGLIK